jgi:hypothetical protein
MMTAVIMGIPVLGDEGGRRPEPFHRWRWLPRPTTRGRQERERRRRSTDAAKSASGNAGKGQVDPEVDKYARLRRMVETQLRRRDITDERILKAMGTVPNASA